MRHVKIVGALAGVVLVGAFVWLLTHEGWLWPSPNTEDEHENHALAPASEAHQVKLSPQAQSNLRLVAMALKADTYWRTIQIPGSVVDRPAYSDRAVVTPATGVIVKVHRHAGDTVWPGEELFTLRLLSETLQLTQSELFKTSQEMEINNEKKTRYVALSARGVLQEGALIEVENQARRLASADKAYRQELLSRGLTPMQVDGVTRGNFVAEVVVKAPPAGDAGTKLLANLVSQAPNQADSARPSFEMQELKVDLGQQVQAGQTLALLSNHQALYIEGRAFRDETPLVEKAAREGWPIHVDFMEQPGGDWPLLGQEFVIRHIANTIDPASRTFAFFMTLGNQARSFDKDDKTFILWRFRPGQKVRLHVKVEKYDNVFVVPADAVVWEGPEAYVFRQNGNLFERKPVRVVHKDRLHVVIANDGSVPPGVFVAQSGAAQLNRASRAQDGARPGFHVHADGTIHTNH